MSILATSLAGCGTRSSDSSRITVAPIEDSLAYSPEMSPAISQASQIIGTNDLVKVSINGSNVDSTLRKYLDAIGLLVMPIPQSEKSGVCTVTHIGNGYAITAGHCFLKGDGRSTLSQESCSDMKVYWGYRKNEFPSDSKASLVGIGNCEKIVYAQLTRDLDFALIKLDKAPQTTIPLELKQKPRSGSKLTILSHPHGRPLEWSRYCGLKEAREVLGVFSGTSSLGAYFFYTCDTEGGSSGSAVLAVSDNSIQMIGVHNAGPDIGANAGTYIHLVDRALSAAGIELSRLAGSKITL